MQLHLAEQLALAAAQARDSSLQTQAARKRSHGIVHTSPELARFVLRAVDELLQDELQLAGGVGDARVHVVDPACGPGAFLAAALQVLADKPRVAATLTGIDLDTEALQLAAALEPFATQLGARLQLRCADTLREPGLLPASQVERVLAIVGNPPWSVAAAEATEQMQQLLETFRCDAAGVRLPEKKLGVLSDAYVRFFRWAAEAARSSSGGAVVGLVTNASFLDGPVHRGMRAALLRWFDRLWVIDLGGNALLSRAQTTSQPDENVFGVRPGVAITLLCRHAEGDADRHGRVRYARLWGARAEKLETLARARLPDLSWVDTLATGDHGRFVPTAAPQPIYAGWPSLAQCMPFHREGVQSNRDAAVVDADKQRLLDRLRSFVQHGSDAQLAAALVPLPHYDPQRARVAVAQALARDPDGQRNLSVRRLAYRPFDTRWFCPVTPLCHRPRPDLLVAVDSSALSLVAVRKDRGSAPYEHFGVAEHVIDNCYLSTRSSCRSRAFPSHTADGAVNLAPSVAAQLDALSDGAADPAQFVAYALCVLASPTYRARFESELRQDYPRIPWPPTAAGWRAVVSVGAELVGLLSAPHAQPVLLTAALQRADAAVAGLLLPA